MDMETVHQLDVLGSRYGNRASIRYARISLETDLIAAASFYQVVFQVKKHARC